MKFKQPPSIHQLFHDPFPVPMGTSYLEAPKGRQKRMRDDSCSGRVHLPLPFLALSLPHPSKCGRKQMRRRASTE